MAAPGKTVAAVNVRVLPKTDNFSPALKKYLDKLERNTIAKIKVDLDTTQATRKAAALVNTLNKLDTKINVDIASNVGNLRGQGERAGQQLAAGIQQAVRRNPPQISPELDRTRFDARLREILSARDLKIIEIDAELAKYRAKISEIRNDPSKVNVSVEADTLLYEARIRRLEAQKHSVNVEVQADVDSLGARLRGGMGSAGASAGRTFTSAFGGALSAASGLVSVLPGMLGRIGQSALQAGSQGAQGMTQLASGASAAAGPIGAAVIASIGLMVLGAVAAVGIPALIGIASAAIQAAGAIGLIPGAMAAVGAGFGALAIGTMGISDALGAMGKAHKAAGGAAGGNAAQQQSAANAIANAQKSLSRAYADAARSREDAARRITVAETGLSRAVAATARANAEADKRVQRATEDLTKARRDAQRAMADLNREVRRGQLNQRRATLDVTQAQIELNQVLSDPAATQMQKELAQLSYDEAVASLDDVIARNQELGEEAQNAATKGVEGFESVISAQQSLSDAIQSQVETRISGEERVSDAVLQVQDAYRAQEQAGIQAMRSIEDAQNALQQAQQSAANSLASGGAAANELQNALNNLSPAARAFVEQIERMRGRFDQLRKAVQEALFSGLDQKLAQLGNTYFPVVEAGLVKIATAANVVAKNLVDVLTEGENVARVEKILDGTSRIMENLGRAMGPIIEAFLILADVGVQVLGDLTEGAEGLATKFRDWIEELSKSGQLKAVFEGALEVIGRVLGAIFKLTEAIGRMILSLGEGVAASGFFDQMGDLLDTFLNFTKSPEGIAFFQTLGFVVGTAGKMFLYLAEGIILVIGWFTKGVQKVLEWNDKLGGIIEVLGRIALAISTLGISELIIAAFNIDWAGLWAKFKLGGSKVLEWLGRGIMEAIGGVLRILGHLVVEILGRLFGLSPAAIESGKKLIDSFIEGIKARAKALRDHVYATIQSMMGLFPKSPAKYGPLSGRGYTTYSGRALMRDFGLGIADEASFVTGIARQAIADLSSEFGLIPDVPSFGDLATSVDTEAAVTTQAEAYTDALAGMTLEINAGTVTRFVNEKNRDNTRR